MLKKDKDRSVAIIGAGFAGLSAAAYLAAEGYQVDVFEKNQEIGGRARQFESPNGFLFDMGPSWYWMPDVFDRFFKDFGYRPSDFYELVLLDPAFAVIFEDDTLTVPANYADLKQLFEEIEPGSAIKLDSFMEEAEFKYNIGMKKLVYNPGLSLTEFFDIDLIKGIFKLQVFTSFSEHVKKYFKNPKLVALMEFPVLFLGATAEDTPALYSLMNYAGLKLGTWYPKGGFGTVIDGMKQVGEKLGVKFHINSNVTAIECGEKSLITLKFAEKSQTFDAVMATADYHHVEQELLPKKFRNYTASYWESRVFAPSCLIFYLGVSKKIDRLNHHNLFFDADLKQHAYEIYKNPTWPEKPLFYVCCPSKTDETVSPEGSENLFVLIPIAPGLEDSALLRTTYFDMVLKRLETYCKQEIGSDIVYKRSYCVNDFIFDYNSFKGNAYGLANTLKQTANLKPSLKNKKIDSLFYAGQLTVPGPGVPPSIISGNVAAKQVIKYFKNMPI